MAGDRQVVSPKPKINFEPADGLSRLTIDLRFGSLGEPDGSDC